MVRVCVIGCGDVSDSHFHGWAGVDPSVGKLVAVCDVDRGRAEAKAKKWGVERVFTDYREVLRRDDIDAVDLPLPHHLHVPVGVAAAKAGKHVLVEKPIGRTVSEASELLLAAKKAGVKLMASQVSFYSPQTQFIKAAIEAGLLGDIKLISFRTIAKKNILAQAHIDNCPWKLTWEGAGGGALARDGIHTTYVMHALANSEVERIFCETDNYLWDTEIDTAAHLLLRYANGATGQFDISWATQASPYRDSLVAGTRGSIRDSERTTGHSEQGGSLVLYSDADLPAINDIVEVRNGLVSGGLLGEKALRGAVRFGDVDTVLGYKPWPVGQRLVTQFMKEHRGVQVGGKSVTVTLPPVNARAVLQTAWCRSILDGTPPPISGYDAAKAMEIVEGAYRSAAEHQVVKLPLIDWSGLS